jgi:hypothetical protein
MTALKELGCILLGALLFWLATWIFFAVTP